MDRTLQLEFCKRCTKREMDFDDGLICSLTKRTADFETTCPNFEKDEVAARREDMKAEGEYSHTEESIQISERGMKKLMEEQNFNAAIGAGIVAGLIGAVLWALITVATGYQIGYMAVAVGFGVGYAIRYFGKGFDPKFGILGAGIALLTCVLGNYFTMIGFTADYENISYLEALGLVPVTEIPAILIDNFEVMDLLFYGFAVYGGYSYSFRQLDEEELLAMAEEERPASNA